MDNEKAIRNVKKGFFALLSGWLLMIIYDQWNVIGWLEKMDNVFLSMIVIILPLIVLTEISFVSFQFLKNKWEDFIPLD